MTSTYLKIHVRNPGKHHWPDAPAEVAFLRHPHRHLFHITATVKVEDRDREEEFFLGQRKVTAAVETAGYWVHEQALWDFGKQSCEHIAAQTLDDLRMHYGEAWIGVAVFEDGENGAEVWA